MLCYINKKGIQFFKMGATESKSEALSKVLNNVSMDVMMQNSTNMSGVIDQSNKLVIGNVKDSSISGVTQTSSAKISVAALVKSATSGELQSSLSAALATAIKQQGAAIGYTANDAKVQNIVENNVNSKVSVQNLMKISTEVKQRNEIIISNADNSSIDTILQSQEAVAIQEMLSEMNNKIVAEIKTSAEISTDLDQKVDSLLGGFGSIIMILVLVVGLVLLGAKNSFGSVMETAAKHKIALMIIAIAFIVIFMFVSAQTESFENRALIYKKKQYLANRMRNWA